MEIIDYCLHMGEVWKHGKRCLFIERETALSLLVLRHVGFPFLCCLTSILSRSYYSS